MPNNCVAVKPSVFAALSIAILIFAGYAGVERGQGGDCARWFERLDETVDGGGVRDAGAYCISGFPYLRADRFSAAIGGEVRDDPASFGV